ncbi:MAG: hypothetical protein IJT58_02140 [Synergistaceae bacterium]|nr:hypothetical protein [Synergistaceae bacterium]
MDNAYISSFAYCREINTTSNNFGDVTQITLLPYLNINMLSNDYSLKAVCVISGIDFMKNNSLNIYFVDPQENILVHYSSEIIKQSPDKVPDALLVQINLFALFKIGGIYTTKIILNGSYLGNFKINITEKDIHA